MRWCSWQRGARTEPNVRATTQELYEGLVAASQNCWPSVRFDVGAINNAVSRCFPRLLLQDIHVAADAQWWLRYEHVIRPLPAWVVRPANPIPIL